MEGLGGAECRLRRGGAALAFCILLPGVPEDIVAWPLLGIDLIPVVSAGHPLAHLGRPATRTDLGEHVQLVLSDPSAPDGPTYRIVSTKAWRFVELGRRLDFVIAGLGWCRMPEQLVTPLLVERRFVRLAVEDDPSPPGPLAIYAAHMRDRPVGRAAVGFSTTFRHDFLELEGHGKRCIFRCNATVLGRSIAVKCRTSSS